MQHDINWMILSGQVVSDLRELINKKGETIVHLTMSSNKGITYARHLILEAQFYGTVADALLKAEIRRGDRLTLQGRMRRQIFNDKYTGKRRYWFYLEVGSFRFDYPPPSTFTNNYRRVTVSKEDFKRFKAMDKHLGPGWIDPSVVEDLGLDVDSLDYSHDSDPE